MKKIVRLLAAVLSAVSILTLSVNAVPELKNSKNSIAPQTNEGRKWRIGYCESQPYFEFDGTLYYLVKGLSELGWIQNADKLPYTPFQQDTATMWKWLSEKDLGPYIEFVADAHYDMSAEPDMGERVIKRLNEKKDIDLVIVNGTFAALSVANDKHDVPSLVFATSNAVQSGIVKAPENSGLKNVWAHMDPDRFKRQVEIFYDIFHFKKLGLVYENSFRKVFAAVDDVEAVAKKKGFEIEHYYVDGPVDANDYERYCSDVVKAHRYLADKIDAMYVTNGAWMFEDLPRLLEPLGDKGIPVFSQAGSIEVRYGALMSIARADFSGIGRFGADRIARVLNGAAPGELSQIFEDTPNIALNMEVAKKVGYKPAFDILLVSDEIYSEIEGKK